MAAAVQIDPVNGGAWSAQYHNFTQGPMLKAGETLYGMVTIDAALEMYKSLDGGATWTLQDAAGQPTGAAISGACQYDQTRLIWVAYSLSPGTLTVSIYDTQTDLWHLDLVAGGPVVGLVFGCCLRSDGTLFIASNGNVPTGLEADIVNTTGLSWVATGIDLAVDITTLPEYDAASCGADNPVFAAGGTSPATTDDIFLGYMSGDSRGVAAEMNNGVYFVGFNLSNVTFNFFVAPNQIGNPQPAPAYRCGNGPFMGPPAVCGAGNIVFPVAATRGAGGNYATIFTSNDSGATWTFDTAANGVDPTITSTFDNAQFAPMASYDGVKVTIVYAQLRNFIFPSPSIRRTVATPDFTANPNTWTWDASTALDISQVPGQAENVNGFSSPKFTTQGGEPILSSDISGGGELTAWFIPFALGPGGRFYGTFHGFMLSGQFSGGTK